MIAIAERSITDVENSLEKRVRDIQN
ncbi:hypothetical protein SCA6_020529 [Theobroma cacao]